MPIENLKNDSRSTWIGSICNQNMMNAARGMHLNPITLSFKDKETETNYNEQFFSNSLWIVRLALLLGAILYSSFAILDITLAPQYVEQLWIIRIFVIFNVSLIAALSFLPVYKYIFQLSLAYVILVSGISTTIMILLCPAPIVINEYFVGIMLIIMSSCAFLRIRFIYAAISGTIVLIFYLYVTCCMLPNEAAILFSNNFFFGISILIGFSVSYTLEYHSRKEFYIRCNNSNNQTKVKSLSEIYEGYDRIEELIKQMSYMAEEKDRIEVELRRREKMFSDLYNNSPDMYFTVSPDGRIRSVNKFGANWLGYEVDELVNQIISTVIYPPDLQYVQKQIVTAMRGGLSEEVIFRKIRKDGSIIWVHERIKVIRNTDDSVKELWINCRDVTQLKEMELKLVSTEGKYRTLFKHSLEGIGFVRQGIFFKVNNKLCEMTGYSEQELKSKMFVHFVHPDDQDLVMSRYLRRMRGEEKSETLPNTYEFRVLTRDGKTIWVHMSSIVMDWEEETVIVVFVTDITELKLQETQYKILFENALEGVGVIHNGKIVLFNKAFCSVVGWSREEIIEKADQLFEYVHPLDKSFAMTNYQKRMEGRSDVIDRYPVRLITREHDIKWISASAAKIPWNGDFATLVFLQDITLLKRVENELSDRRNLLYHVIDSIPFPILYKNISGIYQVVNDSYSKMVGYSIRECIGKTARDILPDYADEINIRDQEVVATQKCVEHEISIKWPNDDKLRNIIVYRVPHFSLNKLVGIIVLCLDLNHLYDFRKTISESK